MKRFTYLFVLLLLTAATYAQQAKYVFYFIGDGMGVNQVNATEMYLAACEGRIGTESLLFTTFPAVGIATTYSASNPITDSAAAGTALATGVKTYNSAISVDTDKQELTTVAERAKRSGRKVGITTSVSVDHATPAAFYAHQPNRKMYYEIACGIPQAGFDFYAGGGFLSPDKSYDKQDAPSVYPILEQAGYTIARGLNDFKAKEAAAGKMILIQPEGADPAGIPYAIDRKPGDLTLAQITQSAISFLTQGRDKGFFLMVEGGRIDWACHDNDPATVINEIIDMDNAVKVAYEFYKKHPKETLIVITADHETGGLGLGTDDYELNLKALSHQKLSTEQLSIAITDLRKNQHASWENVKALLAEQLGFWKELPLTWTQERALRDDYEESFVENKVVFTQSLYSKLEPIAATARKIMSRIAMLGWTTGSHTAGYVPVYAIGAGSKLFAGKYDNTEIPKRIAKAGGYK
ncbi:MAG: alkaline phosphatase [Prevotellaceae bacterium]|jgi:alkaline phosphatase|nr:alkaline phosphatase [Prevotellaceae bacterium]